MLTCSQNNPILAFQDGSPGNVQIDLAIVHLYIQSLSINDLKVLFLRIPNKVLNSMIRLYKPKICTTGCMSCYVFSLSIYTPMLMATFLNSPPFANFQLLVLCHHHLMLTRFPIFLIKRGAVRKEHLSVFSTSSTHLPAYASM